MKTEMGNDTKKQVKIWYICIHGENIHSGEWKVECGEWRVESEMRKAPLAPSLRELSRPPAVTEGVAAKPPKKGSPFAKGELSPAQGAGD